MLVVQGKDVFEAFYKKDLAKIVHTVVLAVMC